VCASVIVSKRKKKVVREEEGSRKERGDKDKISAETKNKCRMIVMYAFCGLYSRGA
jgi:hypothetical protein